MLSYEFYKVLHLVCIILFVGAMAGQFLNDSSKKSLKIISGVTSFLIFVGGMGLLARLGIKHGAGWPVWVWVKVVVWIMVSALGPILAKRLKGNRALAYYGIIVLITIAIYSAVTKLA